MRLATLGIVTIIVTITVTITVCGLMASGCTRTDPSQKRVLGRGREKPLPDVGSSDDAGRAAPRDARPSELILAPPLRMDARLGAEELALLPPEAPMVLAGRADLLDSIARPGGWLAHHLARIPGWKALGELLKGSPSPSEALGLNPKRLWVAALLFFSTSEARALDTALDQHTGDTAPKATALRNRKDWPPLRLRLRLVAALRDPAKTRQALDAMPQAATALGWLHVHPIRSPSLPPALAALARSGARVASFSSSGLALVASIQGPHLVVDMVLPVAGPWGAREAARLLSSAPKGPPATPTPPEDPFGRLALLGGADLTVLVDARGLAEAASWLGMAQAMEAMENATVDMKPELLKEVWRAARFPLELSQVEPRAFDRFALHVHLTAREPLVTLTWRLTPHGGKLLGGLLPKIAGRDLGQGRRFVDEFLRPIEKQVPAVLPPVGPWKDALLFHRLSEGSPFMPILAVTELWPRLLPLVDLRRAVLAYARQRLKIGRMVGPMNLERAGELLRLRLSMRPLGGESDPDRE